ncbi:MAG: nitrate ABC transporter permease [Synechococcales bacterium]|nr:nitrate ABC transporter permease [Synechococcales bacterium]
MAVNTPVKPKLVNASQPSAAKFFNQFQVIIAPIICTAIVLLIWQMLFGGADSKMPSPTKVVAQMSGSLGAVLNPNQEGSIAKNILISLGRVGIGYGLASIFGILAGVLIGVSKFLRSGFDPMVQILRTIPPLAWLPLALAMFQENNAAALFLIFITAIWPILINTAVGVQQIPKDYNNVAKVLRLSGIEYFFSILIPSTVPYIFTGLRIGIGLAWLAIVAAEMLKSDGGGIGFYIWDAYNAGNDDSMSQIILAVFFVGLVGLALDRLVAWLGSLLATE